MASPDISVVVPARNEAGRLAPTLQNIAAQRTSNVDVEFVVVDDASTDGCCDELAAPASDVTLTVVRLDTRGGVPTARNAGVETASGDALFITDAHVRVSAGWDEQLLGSLEDGVVVAGSIADAGSEFVGHGCKLVVPYMGTHWNREKPDEGDPVHVASSAATGVTRDTFQSIGGYDEGMLYYGSAEPEFSVRAWLSGVSVRANPALVVEHEFKSGGRASEFVDEHRTHLTHNSIRFGFRYLDELACLEMVRHFTQLFPEHVPEAFELIEQSDVWAERDRLASELPRDFGWFVDRFDLEDSADREIAGYEGAATASGDD